MAQDSFAGKVAVITGAANGIGAAAATRLAGLGAQVVLGDVDDVVGEELAGRLGATFVHTDVTDPEADDALVARTLELHGRVDVVHLNAGVSTGTTFGPDFDPVAYRRAMAVNLDGVVYGVQAAIGPLLAQGSGQIVVTASMAGLTAVPFDPVYGANKTAVVGLVRSLGALYANEGIRVNALCPSFAETDIIADIREFLVDTGFPILDVDDVVDTFMAIVTGEGTGNAWFVVAGRDSQPFEFRNVPGPRTR